MKGAGKYNPITQEVSGSGEYTKTDYQENRKDTMIRGGAVLAAIVLFIAVLWYFWNEIKAMFDGLIKGVSIPTGAIPQSTVSAANSQTSPAGMAKNDVGQYYPVKTLTATDYDNMLKSLGMLQPVVRAGNIITPPGALDAAALAGSESAKTVNKLGLNNAYVDLPNIQKGLVTLGEGIGKLAGVDLIQAGYDFRSAISSSMTNTPPPGEE